MGQPEHHAGYERRYNTIAHEVLDIESAIEPVDETKYRLVDEIIDEVVKAMPARQQGHERRFALEFFQRVDAVLVRRGFVFPVQGQTATLREGLTPRSYDASQLVRLRALASNTRRIERIDAAEAGSFYPVDCDVSSLLYLAAAEVMGLAVWMVEMPGHNFVRWHSPAVRLNWDTNLGIPVTDEEYVAQAKLPGEVARSGMYLVDMERQWVLGYWYGIRGKLWYRNGEYAKAKEDLVRAEASFPTSGEIKIDLAMMLATCPGEGCRDGSRAVRLAREATGRWPNPYWLDVLAGALSETGAWEEAIATEERARGMAATAVRPGFTQGPWPDFDAALAAYAAHKRLSTLMRERSQAALPSWLVEVGN